MTLERWQRAKEIFHAALDRAPGERSAFLASACGGDESLRQEVESLISSHEKDGSFIDSPAYEVAADIMETEQQLKPGQMIGKYEIISTLGRGGMGEVYLAADSNLGRKVALKFLPASFMNDPDRLRRFEQEARAASALNQPNILTIHEIGETDHRRFIATEYIEGETLRQRILTGPLALAETLDIAEQVATALVAAHAAGIIHRDIKPENIMVRRDGIVKVLDFGLAKIAAKKDGTSEDSTRALIKTSAGIVMGTVSYMSPEQGRGLPVDVRTDIWSLGVLMYEMIGGSPPFTGATPSDVLVAVLERTPPSLTIVIPGIPETFEFVVAKALAKERDGRYQTAHEILTDIRLLKQRLHPGFDQSVERRHTTSPELVNSKDQQPAEVTAEGLGETQSTGATQRTERRALLRNQWLLATAALVVLVGALIAVYILFVRPKAGIGSAASPTEVLRTTQITTPTGLEIPALSPDGDSIAYSSDRGAGLEIFVKPLTPGAREIQLTSDGEQNNGAAWSPDGKLIAFRSEKRGGVWVIPASGGTAKQLTDFGSSPAWSHDGSLIAFQTLDSNLPPTTIWVVPSQGGDPVRLTQPGNPSGGHNFPAWSPDGKWIVFAAEDGAGGIQLWAVATSGGNLKQIAAGFSNPVYSPDGEYIYAARGRVPGGNFALYKIHISSSSDRIGEPVVIRDTGLARIEGRLTISRDGKKLAYSAQTLSGNLMSVPISPKSGEATASPTPFTQNSSYRKGLPVFSPDGKRIAFMEFRGGEQPKIWATDADGRNATQLTTGPTLDWSPSWFPDNDTVAFESERDGTSKIWSVSISTRREKLLIDPGFKIGWPRLSPDGKQFAFGSANGGAMNTWIATIGGGAPRQLTFDAEQMAWPCWSPDGKLLALEIRRGNDSNIAIMPSTGGAVTQLTFDHGLTFVHDWSPDGDKIVFAGQRNGIWNVYWVSLATKQQKQVTHYTRASEYVRYPAWSPLGNQIVYEYAETMGNIWLMELK